MSRYNSKIIKINKPSKQKQQPKHVEKHRVDKLNISLDQSFNSDSILKGFDRILQTQWGSIPPQLNTDFKQHITNYRSIIPNLVSKSQLYSLFLNQNSFVDQQVQQLLQKNQLVQIIIHNSQFTSDLLIKTDDYLAILEKHINSGLSDVGNLTSFKQYVQDTNFNPVLKLSDLEPSIDIKTLKSLQYISIIPNTDQFNLSIPNFGFIIQLYQLTKKFILSILKRTRWKEIPLDELVDKWNRYKLKFKDFKGLNIDWILHYLIGEGLIEIFRSFDKRIIRLI